MFICVCSHRRSGTHRMIDLIREHFPVLDGFFHLEELSDLTGPKIIKTHEPSRDHKLALFSARSAASLPLMRSICRHSRYIYVVRSPWDVMVSLYYFFRGGGEPAFQIPPDLSFEDFLAQTNHLEMSMGLTRPEYWAWHVCNWCRHKDVLIVRYESGTCELVEQIAQWTELTPKHMPHTLPPTSVGRGLTQNRIIWNDRAASLMAPTESLAAKFGYCQPAF